MGQQQMLARLHGILSLCLPFGLGGCNWALLDPKGQIGADEKTLILVSAGLMLLVVIPVIVMACVFAYKYRASNTKATYKPEWDTSHKIEYVVWGVPCLIVIALSIICWKSTHDLDPFKPIQSSVKPVEIDVIALDWKWLFIYPEQHIATVNQVAFPVDTPVKFVITSDSVMNSFFIPRLGSQIITMPGMKATLWLIANEAGTYQGLSAHFSGKGFSGMVFDALAVSPDEFSQWVAKAAQSQDHLTPDTYADLAKPSENVPVLYYSSVTPDLFDSTVNKYMGMVMDQGDAMKMNVK